MAAKVVGQYIVFAISDAELTRTAGGNLHVTMTPRVAMMTLGDIARQLRRIPRDEKLGKARNYQR